jgi:hypothetical protein
MEQAGRADSTSLNPHVKIWDDTLKSALCYALVNLQGGDGGALVAIASSHAEAASRCKALDEHLKQKATISLTWDDVALDGRGVFGETILHVAFLLKNRELIAFLVERFSQKAWRPHATKKFLDASYTHELYKGPLLLRFSALQCDFTSSLVVYRWDSCLRRGLHALCNRR